MNESDRQKTCGLESALALERPRLVRLCAKITGDGNAAEGLAQETLIEAWHHLQDLREQERFPQWLSGIAHNVCRRWTRKRGRDLLQQAKPLPDPDAMASDLEESLVDDFDIEIELERKELIDILDRALTLLTPEARALLSERYVEDSPIAEVAARMGVHSSVVAMRLQRGKIALRRVLTTELGKAQTTQQSDIYSIGVLLHHLLSGEDPSEKPFLLSLSGFRISRCYSL